MVNEGGCGGAPLLYESFCLFVKLQKLLSEPLFPGHNLRVLKFVDKA